MVAIPDLIVRLLKWPFDLLHDQFCPCRHFNCAEKAAEFEAHQCDGLSVGRGTP